MTNDAGYSFGSTQRTELVKVNPAHAVSGESIIDRIIQNEAQEEILMKANGGYVNEWSPRVILAKKISKR